MIDVNLELKPAKITAFVRTTEGRVTIFSKGLRGVIVSASTEEEAKKLFEEAMKLTIAVKNLWTYNNAYNSTINKAKEVMDTLENGSKLEYDLVPIREAA